MTEKQRRVLEIMMDQGADESMAESIFFNELKKSYPQIDSPDIREAMYELDAHDDEFGDLPYETRRKLQELNECGMQQKKKNRKEKGDDGLKKKDIHIFEIMKERDVDYDTAKLLFENELEEMYPEIENQDDRVEAYEGYRIIMDFYDEEAKKTNCFAFTIRGE